MKSGSSKIKIKYKLNKSVKWFRDWDCKNSINNLKRIIAASNQENELKNKL